MTNEVNREELNPKQKEAAEAPSVPLLIVAGAGTGKTKTLTSRIVHLILSGVSPDRICAVTFTNKAAKEMKDRVAKVCPPQILTKGKEPYIGTLHSFGARILRNEARYLGRTKGFVIFDDHDSNQVIKKIVKKYPLTKTGSGPSFFARRISDLKNGKLTEEDFLESKNPNDKYTLKIFKDYEENLLENNAFDFDDLLTKTVDLFKSQPEVLEKYQKLHSHILVDEYQDINNTQYELIRLLALPTGNLSVVGDDQQTIYSWRGSNFEIFLNFEKEWPNSKVVVLDQNYRSSENIISAASEVVSNNLKQKPKKLWTEKGSGELLRLIEAGSEEEEAYWVAGEIKKDPSLETAILYRTNAQSRAIEQALIEKGVPYRIYGGLKFYERKEIKDLVCGVRLALNPKESVSLERLEKNIGKTRTKKFLLSLRESEDKSPIEAIETFLESTDYLSFLESTEANFNDRKENISELIRFSEKFLDIPTFLEQITLLQATDNIKTGEENNGKEIQMMTIHLAKGLEFDRVFIVGCGEGLMPHSLSMESEAEIEEERRLMYVAMTRAKHELIISFYDIPSRFISEIPMRKVRYESLTGEDQEFSDSEERYITLD